VIHSEVLNFCHI